MKAVVLEGNAVNPGDISWEPFTKLIETKIYDNTTQDEKWDRLAGYDVVITNKVTIDEEVFERFPDIKYVGVNATGYNVVDLMAARKRNIPVTNIPAYSTDSVVQFTWAMILNLASKIDIHEESVKNGDWTRSAAFCYWIAPIQELANKTIGIYGFGNIGRGVAKVAESFGMKVLVCTAHPEKYDAYCSESVSFCDAETLFCSSDVLTFHCPLTPETTGIVNRNTLAMMKPESILINVARGGVVVEEDLAAALRGGTLRAAALDVISQEPMMADSPLIGVPNLVITPHIAWASREARMRLVDIAAENLKGFLEGKPINVVNA